MSRHEVPRATIADVSRETRLSKDTLRVWERRYGFPVPTRNSKEERVYSSEQIQRLRVIRRLLDSGVRPGKIVGLSIDELNSFDAPVHATPEHAQNQVSPAPQQILGLIKTHRVESVHQLLVQRLMQLGLRQFILEVIVPLNHLVGEAWLNGSIEVFGEHLYTHQVQSLLQQAIGAMPPSSLPPRVLLTTLPGEQHQLGNLMAQAFFAMEGAQCVSLGTETPPSDILRAADAFAVNVVGLCCTEATAPRLTQSQLSLLRHSLHRDVELWVGGSPSPAERHRVPGVRYVGDLREIPTGLAQWRAQRSTP